MRIAQNYPSGAITVVVRHSAGAEATADSNGLPIVNMVRVRENGPLAVEAELLINGQATGQSARHNVPLWPESEQTVL